MVSEGDAAQFLSLVIEQQAAQNSMAAAVAATGRPALGAAAADSLLASLASDLAVRCAAVRQLMAEGVSGRWGWG